MFGRRFTPVVDREAAFAAMNALLDDRSALRDQLVSILALAKEQPEVDADNVAVIGYCFGGLCTLDLARSGADFRGAASFLGLFKQPGLPKSPIKPKVVAFHGWDDPMVPPEDVVALGNELTEAGADWQIHCYGHVGHGFTNPNAGQMGIKGVEYNEAAERRSWTSLVSFLAETLG
jgi:dienelactone hydrolase